MNTTKCLSVIAAILAHVALVAAIVLWPRHPQPIAEPDFVVPDPSLLVQLPLDFTNSSSLRCEVHDIQMAPAEVPIYYGTLVELEDPQLFAVAFPSEPSAPSRKELFPHSEHATWGGCVVGTERNARIWICSECERAEKEWRRARQNPK